MVCIICFDVFVLIRVVKHDRYSSKVIKLVNNPAEHDVSGISLANTGQAMHWLKMAELQHKYYVKRALASCNT